MPSLCISISCLIFSTVTLALLASSKKLIDDLDLSDAPRAFYNLQERYSPPLIPVQILLLLSELLLTLSAIRYAAFKDKAKQVQELENSPLTNYIISQLFMYLTKGLSLLISIVFAYICKVEIDKIRGDYQFDSDESTKDDMDSSDDMIQAAISILIINIIIMIIGSSLGCYDTGKRAAPKTRRTQEYVELTVN